MSSLPPRHGLKYIIELARCTRETGQKAAGQVLVIEEQLEWARSIARGVRQSFDFRLGSQEEQDLESTAYLAVVELASKFDVTRVPPTGDVEQAFRGWATIEVRNRCQREARRLRNGGTYHTRREVRGKAIVVKPLQRPLDVIDPRSLSPRPDLE